MNRQEIKAEIKRLQGELDKTEIKNGDWAVYIGLVRKRQDNKTGREDMVNIYGACAGWLGAHDYEKIPTPPDELIPRLTGEFRTVITGECFITSFGLPNIATNQTHPTNSFGCKDDRRYILKPEVTKAESENAEMLEFIAQMEKSVDVMLQTIKTLKRKVAK